MRQRWQQPRRTVELFVTVFTEPRICLGCGKSFIPTKPRSGYYAVPQHCSTQCRLDATRKHGVKMAGWRDKVWKVGVYVR